MCPLKHIQKTRLSIQLLHSKSVAFADMCPFVVYTLKSMLTMLITVITLIQAYVKDLVSVA